MQKHNSYLSMIFVCFLSSIPLQCQDTTPSVATPSSQDLFALMQQQSQTLATILERVSNSSVPQPPSTNNITISPIISPQLTATSSMQVMISHYMQQIQDASSFVWQTTPALYEQSRNLIFDYRKELVAGTAISVYTSLVAYFQYQYYTVFASHAWIHWCNHLTLPELVSASTSSLSEKLLQDIHMRYFNKQNVQDVIIPYATFIQEIDLQINAAQTYMHWYSVLNTCYIASFFGLRQSTYERVKEARTRLSFIKNIFMSWISEQTLVSNKKN